MGRHRGCCNCHCALKSGRGGIEVLRRIRSTMPQPQKFHAIVRTFAAFALHTRANIECFGCKLIIFLCFAS